MTPAHNVTAMIFVLTRASDRRGKIETKSAGIFSISKLFLFIIFCSIGSIVSARAQYRLEPGDVLEIGVASVPDSRHRVAITEDGTIIYPFAGRLNAAGSTVDELTAKLQALLSNKSVRQRTREGRENAVLISADEVTVDLAEYRPIYIDGDVSRPGELKYRPGLSVGEAIAVSGGYQMAFLRTAIPTNPFDLKSELEQLQVERFKEQIRINRLNAELSGTAGISLTSIKAPEIGPDFARAIAALEIEQAQGRLVEYNNEVDHLKRTLAQGEKYTAILKEQLTKQSTGSEADTAELNRIRELFERGTVPMLRYSDVRRAQLLGEERFLQTRAQMEQVARDQLDVGRQLARLQERRKLEIAQALQDAKLKLEIANKKIVNLESKFQTWRSGRVRTAPMADNPAEISITRGPAGKKETVRASEDTGLLAGDLVRVRLREATEWRGQ